MTLYDFLKNYGWDSATCEIVSRAYDIETGVLNKARAAAETCKWMDDSEHDYSGEMLDCIYAWLVERDESRLDHVPDGRQMVGLPHHNYISPLSLPG